MPKHNEEFLKSLIGNFVLFTYGNSKIEIGLVTEIGFDDEEELIPFAFIYYVSSELSESVTDVRLSPYESDIHIKAIHE